MLCWGSDLRGNCGHSLFVLATSMRRPGNLNTFLMDFPLARNERAGRYLRHDVQHFAPNEAEASFLARYVWIIFRIIVKMGAHPNFAFSLAALAIRRHQFEGDRSLRILLQEEQNFLIDHAWDADVRLLPKLREHRLVSSPPRWCHLLQWPRRRHGSSRIDRLRRHA